MKFPILFVSTFSIGFFCDFASKRWAESELSEKRIEILGDFLSLKWQTNSGIAFSAPVTGLPLKILTVLLIALIVSYYFRNEELRGKPAVDVAYAAFLAGAVWNGIDRILMGKVTDFIDLKYFANFNVADIMITVSAAAVVAIHFFHERSRKSR